jgi:hypothetical protein
MSKPSAMTPELLRELAELKGLDLSEELLQKLQPLVTDLLVMADCLKQSEIWKAESGDPLLSEGGKQ